jgi:DnaK suppressor protein
VYSLTSTVGASGARRLFRTAQTRVSSSRILRNAEEQMTRKTIRLAALRQMLITRRREMEDEVHSRLHDSRSNAATDVRDEGEVADGHIQTELRMTVLQMRTQAAVSIDEALRRLDAGKYGACAECQQEITERRLRAMPFAVRCQACEQRREEAREQAGQIAGRRDSLSLFPDVMGP